MGWGPSRIYGICIDPRSGKILLVKNRRLKWGLPGGHKYPNQGELKTIRREFYEETGLTIWAPKPDDLFDYNNNGSLSLFVVVRMSGERKLREKFPQNGDIVEARWCSPDCLPQPLKGEHGRVIEKYLAKR